MKNLGYNWSKLIMWVSFAMERNRNDKKCQSNYKGSGNELRWKEDHPKDFPNECQWRTKLQKDCLEGGCDLKKTKLWGMKRIDERYELKQLSTHNTHFLEHNPLWKNCICWNHTTLQWKFKKQLIYNCYATIFLVLQLLCNYPLRNTVY